MIASSGSGGIHVGQGVEQLTSRQLLNLETRSILRCPVLQWETVSELAIRTVPIFSLGDRYTMLRMKGAFKRIARGRVRSSLGKKRWDR